MEELRYSLETASFRGVQTLTGEMTVDPKFAVEAINIEFIGDSLMIPRRGMGRFYDLTLSIGCRSSQFWQNDHGAFTVVFGISGGSGALYAIKNMYGASPSLVLIEGGLNATAARFSVWGNQLLVALLNDAQVGSDAARIITYDGTNFASSRAFPAPISTTFSFTVSAVSGVTTVGRHYVGYIPEYTDGHLGKACPDTSGGGIPTAQDFEPILVEITTESPDGGATINGSFTSVAWPSNIKALHLIMTPVTNSYDFYFVPGGRVSVPSGTTATVTFSIDTADSELFKGDSANEHIYYYGGGTSVLNPFLPHNVFVYGRRIGWITNIPAVTSTLSVIFMSAIDNPQALRLDTGLLKMPDGSNILAALALDNSILIGGSSGLAMVQDTQADPATWPVKFIDESRGIATVNAFVPDKSAPSGQNEAAATKCWVVLDTGITHTAGLSLNPRTLCEQFRQGWWNRINWKNGAQIQAVDWPERFLFMLLVPLDGATQPTHVFCFHYMLGKAENQINFHVTQVASYRIGSMCMVHNANPFVLVNGRFRDELFMFSYDQDKFILRAKEEDDYDPIRNQTVTLHTDDVDTVGEDKINAVYVTSARPKLPKSLNKCGPITFHAGGAGTLQPFAVTYPNGKQVAYKEYNLSDHVEPEILQEGVSVRRTKIFHCTAIRVGFQMKGPGDWAIIQYLITEHEPATAIPGSYKG